MGFWGRYVPVAERKAKASRAMAKLRKKGENIDPVEIEGRTIARSFWGKAWCDHLESFSDYKNRLPRGTRYVRNGSVCHLEVRPGLVKAIVSGSSLYRITVTIKKLKAAAWSSIKKNSTGQVGSMLELLQGKLSDEVMKIVTDRKHGLFPQPDEIELDCSCPDWAIMCKHVAATLYGVGSRLDQSPELLFLLRGVDPDELIASEISLPEAAMAEPGASLADDQLADIFGIDLDTPGESEARSTKGRKTKEAAINLPKIRPTGKSVARLRKQLGLTTSQFAKALGVSPGSVYKWEATQGRLTLRIRSHDALAALTLEARERGLS